MDKKIDIHLNLAGVGTNRSGCSASPSFRRRYSFLFFRLMYGFSNRTLTESADRKWVNLLVNIIKQSREVDYGVCLGFDRVYDKNGRHRPEWDQMVVPHEWVFSVCEENNELLPGPGLHPYRPNALDMLDEYNERKACLIKWLPPAQNIDADDPKLIPFYQKLADVGIPLLVHTGTEKTFKTQKISKDYIDVMRLKLALDHGVKVIAAHTATGVLGSGETVQRNQVLQLLSDYPNFWVENSGICNPGRAHNLFDLSLTPEISNKTLYGSDFPVPSNAIYYVKKFGFKKVLHLERIRNLIDRDVAIKREAGFDNETLTRPQKVLSHLDYWLAR